MHSFPAGVLLVDEVNAMGGSCLGAVRAGRPPELRTVLVLEQMLGYYEALHQVLEYTLSAF
jgi:hypothetical protein